MPPKAVKTIAYRHKLPIRRQEAEPSPSPSPPAKKHKAATTTVAQAQKLQREAPSTFTSRWVEITEIALSSSSTSFESTDSTDSSSLINETNVHEKIAELVERSQTRVDAQGEHFDDDVHRSQIHDDDLPQGVHIFGGNLNSEEEEEAKEEEERGQVKGDTTPKQEQTNAQVEEQNTAQ